MEAEPRQRREAARKAAALLTLVHAIAVVGTVVLAAGLFTSVVGGWAAWSGWSAGLAEAFSGRGAMPDSGVADAPIIRSGLPLGLAAWLVLGPVALYVALRRD